MALNVRKASRFVRVASSTANIPNESVDLLFEGEDGEHYAIEMDAAIISAVLTAIQGEANELHASLPQLVDQPAQVLNAVDLMAGKRDDGSLFLRFALEGDLNIDVQYPKEAFRRIEPLIAEIHRIVRSV